jgi:regulation of enolase protein 1 (concanavalin A-like superfamily)
MKNIVILIYNDIDRERLREYIKQEDIQIVSTYQRADWQNQPKGRPGRAIVVRIKNPKKEFEIRMKFDTFPRKGVEF